jgi:cellulose synthase (UDP-forming)
MRAAASPPASAPEQSAPPPMPLNLRLAGYLLLVAGLYASSIPLAIDNQAVVSFGILAVLLGFRAASRRAADFGRLAIVVLCGYLSLRYWMFRTTETIAFTGIWDHLFLVLLYLAESYGILTHLLGLFVNVAPLQRSAPPLPADRRAWPTVDVLVPTYNEPVEMVAVTLTACAQLDYPREKLNIFVLDDGGTTEKLTDPDPSRAAAARRRAAQLRDAAARLGVHYLTRERNVHAKAGNINAALGAAVDAGGGRRSAPRHNPGLGHPRPQGDLVMVLDCDHVPARDFLQRTVGFFTADERLACVQTPHFFINPTPVEKNLDTQRISPGENEMFYGGIQLGLDFWNASFFCGSAAVLRRRCLLEIGGFVEDTITEDAGTALKLHSRGLNSVYLNRAMIMGLSPETFDGFIVQRSRWAKGMIQILLLRNPLVQLGLSLSQRLCYLNACLFWLFGFARIVFFISPLMFLLFGLRVYNASLAQALVYAVPHLMASFFVSNTLYGRLRHPFYSELYEIIQSIYLIPAVLGVFLRPRAPRFRVTPKAISLARDRLTHLATPFYVMFLLNLMGFCAGGILWINQPALIDTIAICLVWNAFNTFLVVCCLGVVWERRQLRAAHRFAARETTAVRIPGRPEAVAAAVIDLSLAGIGLEVAAELPAEVRELTLVADGGSAAAGELPLRVMRRSAAGGRTRLGCRFEVADPDVRRRLVDYVYGDSGRWKYFADGRPGASLGTFRAFGRLARIGMKGAGRSLAGMGRMVRQRLRPTGSI